MSGLIEKSVNLGLGLFSYSREKIEEVVDELVNKGEVTRKDAKDLVNDLVKKGEEQREDFKKMVKDEVLEALDAKGIARKEDLMEKEDFRKIIKEELIDILKMPNALPLLL